MNSIEEKLWNYLDNSCTPEERQEIEALIATDEKCQEKYQQIIAFNKELEAIDLETPPMAFTYNVMEALRAETAQTPLKAAIDNRIIKGIAAFFCILIAALIVVAIGNTDWTAINQSNSPVLKLDFNLSSITGYLNGTTFRAFLFFDVVLALFLTDSYLQRKRLAK